MSKKKHRNKKAKKNYNTISNISQENRYQPEGRLTQPGRGAQVYSLSNLINIHGQTKFGRGSAKSDNPYFSLNPIERNSMFQLSSPVFGIVSSRMNRVSALNFEITFDKEEEEQISESLINAKNMIKEYEGLLDLKYMIASAKLKSSILEKLPTVRPDLANFDKALLRWKRSLAHQNKQKADDIKSWLEQPNPIESWVDFVKIWVYDLMVHGASAIYKDVVNNKVNNIQHLAGGTTIPMRTPYVDSKEAYIQQIDYRYQIFYEDEVVFSQYMPVSWRSYPMVPLEALINKISEGLLFDKLMADQADGTKPPEKMVIVTDNQIFGNGESDLALEMPLEQGEQKRVEEKFNQPIKNGIITFSGNNVEVVDITKENTMDFQNRRQKDIREEVALVFNASNIEVNLTGSEDTSGRATSEVQADIDQAKGIAPILRTIEKKINSEILPYRYGTGWTFKFKTEDSEEKQVDLLRKKKDSGLYSINELRIEELNRMPFEGDQYEKPGEAQVNSEVNPFFTRSTE